jgi:hypothetical protein
VAAPQGDRRRQARSTRFARVVEEEMQRIRREVGDARFQGGRFPRARELFVRLLLHDFLSRLREHEESLGALTGNQAMQQVAPA